MEKKNTGLVILVIVLLVALLGTSGFIVYDKVLSKKTVENIDVNNTNNDVINNNEEKNNDNSYQIFADNLKDQISKYNSNNQSYQYINNDIVKGGYVVYLNEKGSLFVKYFDKELNDNYGDYKIADNVLSFYAINVGQDVGNMLYFINEDGTVGSADTEYGIGTNNQITIKKDIGYRNIVSIVNGIFGDEYSGLHGPIFIDINGNIFSENLK